MQISRFPELRTARLRLREILPRDAPAWFALQSNPEVMRWYGADPMHELAQMQRLIGDCAAWRISGTAIRWGIEFQGELIGSCGFARWNRAWHNCMLGYELAPAFQQRGLMQEALSSILTHGFAEMQLHRVVAEIHHQNPASLKLVQKLGFQYEGVHREVGMWGGRWHDLDCYSLLEQDWLSRLLSLA